MSKAPAVASAARFIAGTLAALWGMVGLTLAYSFASLYGAKPAIIVAVALNVALVTAAALAFVNARRWRGVLLVSIVLVTLDRLFNLIFTGANAWAVIIDLAALLAIVAITVTSPSSRRRTL